jgi:uncharacterized membrane protein (DUF2068 family)
MRRARGLQLILAYKITRAAVSGLGSVVALWCVALGLSASLHRAAQAVHDHAASALSIWASEQLLSAVRPGHLAIVGMALAVDAAVLTLESWSLWRGESWGAWLVVIATGMLLPFELAALIAHPAAGRLALLAINAAVVSWLLRHAVRLHRASE